MGLLDWKEVGVNALSVDQGLSVVNRVAAGVTRWHENGVDVIGPKGIYGNGGH